MGDIGMSPEKFSLHQFCLCIGRHSRFSEQRASDASPDAPDLSDAPSAGNPALTAQLLALAGGVGSLAVTGLLAAEDARGQTAAEVASAAVAATTQAASRLKAGRCGAGGGNCKASCWCAAHGGSLSCSSCCRVVV